MLVFPKQIQISFIGFFQFRWVMFDGVAIQTTMANLRDRYDGHKGTRFRS